ncbi:MAG: hypothetical protein ACR2FY_15410 [Pirellulaceae bacterium]
MSVTEIVQQLGNLSDADRLVVISAASSLMTKPRLVGSKSIAERQARLAAAAATLKEYYERDKEVMDWQLLDAEEVHDDHLAG